MLHWVTVPYNVTTCVMMYRVKLCHCVTVMLCHYVIMSCHITMTCDNVPYCVSHYVTVILSLCHYIRATSCAVTIIEERPEISYENRGKHWESDAS